MRPTATGKQTRQPRGNPASTVRMARPMERVMGAIATRGDEARARVGPGVRAVAFDNKVKHRGRAQGRLVVRCATRVGAGRAMEGNLVAALWANPAEGEAARGLTAAIKISGKTVCRVACNLIQ